MIEIRNCSSFAHEFSTASGAMDSTEVVVTSGKTVVLSSIVSYFNFTTGISNDLADGPIANVPRVHLTDSNDNIIFGFVPTRSQVILGLSSANPIPDSTLFQIPGRGLLFRNGLKVNALAPAPVSGGMRLTVNLVYQT